MLVDPDGAKVIPTSILQSNSSVNTFYQLAVSNSVWQDVMKSFYKDQNNVYVHLAQLKRSDGTPSGVRNAARAQSYRSSNNPVSRYGYHRIIINSDVLNSSGDIGVDLTFLFMALVHEGDHARMFERYKQSGRNFSDYPGYQDFLVNRRSNPKDDHHNLMGKFSRTIFVDAMKEFDQQITNSGGTVPAYHTEDWYQAMSWYGLRRTKAWDEFKSKNPQKASLYNRLIMQQVQRNEDDTK